MSGDLSRLLNALGLLLVSAVLVIVLVAELWFGDLPCPLCLLQRVAFVAAGFGLALNLIFGPKPSHYGIAILGAAAGAAISMRQIVLHIVPGTGTYGEPVLGLHLYTWAFVIFAVMIVGSAVMLLSDRQFARVDPLPVKLKGLPLFAFGLFLVASVACAAAALALCGLSVCPDTPERYLLFNETSF